MKITYDKQVDAMYILLNERAAYKSSKKVTEDLVVDYAENGQVIGVEILAASKNSVMPKGKNIAIEQKSIQAQT